MARLIFEKVAITPEGNTSYSDNTNIAGIVTDSVTIGEEALQVIIEDNQAVNEGYTTTMSFRTRDNQAVGGAELSTLAYFGGASSPAKKRLTMFGVNGGDDFYVDNVYVMGRRVFENGREEYEISCQIDSTTQKIVKA